MSAYLTTGRENTYNRRANVTTRHAGGAREGTTAFWCVQRELTGLRDKSCLLRMTVACGWDRRADLSPDFHLREDFIPCSVLSEISRVTQYVEAMLCSRKRNVDTVDALKLTLRNVRFMPWILHTFRNPMDAEELSSCPEFLTSDTMTIFASRP